MEENHATRDHHTRELNPPSPQHRESHVKQQKIMARRQPATTTSLVKSTTTNICRPPVPDHVDSGTTQAKHEDLDSLLREVQQCNAEIERQRGVQQQHDETIQRIKTKIMKEETNCGYLMQQRLEIEAAIRIQREHIAQDYTELEKKRDARKQGQESIDRDTTRLTALISTLQVGVEWTP